MSSSESEKGIEENWQHKFETTFEEVTQKYK